jgi:hypothetical protein
VDTVLYKNILATVTYYDVLEYPLTSFEIWKQMIRYSGDSGMDTWSLGEVHRALAHPALKEYLQEKNGLYFLYGRDQLVRMRRERENISRQKVRRALKIVSLLRICPFVRMICLTGRLSYMNGERTSDLDLMIVYEKGHIWTGRLLLTIMTHVLGVRRHDTKVNDRICLNYHITTGSLEVPTKDLFAAHEYVFIYPLFDTGYYMDFCVANKWIATYKPHYTCDHRQNLHTLSDTIVTRSIRTIGEWIMGDTAMEKRCAHIQQKKIQKNPKTHQEGAIVLCSDAHLVFLPNPHGPRVFEAYKKNFDALEIAF